MGELVNKFKRKLSDEAATYAVQRLACDTKATDITEELRKEFGITISSMRVKALLNTKKWCNIHEIAREEYLNKIRDFSGIALAVQRKRLQDGEKMRERIFRLIEKLEKSIETDEKATNSYDYSLVRELRGLMEIYLKVLKYGKEETDKNQKQGSTGFNKFMAEIVDAEVVKNKELKDKE